MKNIELTFITDDIENVKNCKIENCNTKETITINLPKTKIEEIFYKFKRKYPNFSKSYSNQTYTYSFSDIDNDDLSNLITASLNYQEKNINKETKKYQKNMIISIVATIIIIAFNIYIGPGADLPFIAIPIDLLAIGSIGYSIIKTNETKSKLSKIIGKNKKMLNDINNNQNKQVATINNQLENNHIQNKTASLLDTPLPQENKAAKKDTRSYSYDKDETTSPLDIPLDHQSKNEEAKKDTKTYSYDKDEPTSPLDIPFDYQIENEEEDDLSNDFDVLTVFEKPKKGPRR